MSAIMWNTYSEGPFVAKGISPRIDQTPGRLIFTVISGDEIGTGMPGYVVACSLNGTPAGYKPAPTIEDAVDAAEELWELFESLVKQARKGKP